MLPPEPPLWMGTIFAIFIWVGTTEFCKDKLMMCWKGLAISYEHCLIKCTESPEKSVLVLFCKEEITLRTSEWVTGLSVKLNRGIPSSTGGSGPWSVGGMSLTISEAAVMKKLFNDSAMRVGSVTSWPLIERHPIPELFLDFWLIVSLSKDQVFFRFDLWSWNYLS